MTQHDQKASQLALDSFYACLRQLKLTRRQADLERLASAAGRLKELGFRPQIYTRVRGCGAVNVKFMQEEIQNVTVTSVTAELISQGQAAGGSDAGRVEAAGTPAAGRDERNGQVDDLGQDGPAQAEPAVVSLVEDHETQPQATSAVECVHERLKEMKKEGTLVNP